MPFDDTVVQFEWITSRRVYMSLSAVAFLSQHEARARCKSCNSPLVLPNLGRCQDVSCCTVGEAVSTRVRQQHISWVRRVVCANDSISIPPLQNLPWRMFTRLRTSPAGRGRGVYRVESCSGFFFFFLASNPFEVRGYRTSSPPGAQLGVAATLSVS